MLLQEEPQVAESSALVRVCPDGRLIRSTGPGEVLQPVLQQVAQAEAGMGVARVQLDSLLEGRGTKELLHNDVIMKLDEAAQAFNVVLLKSDMTLPYTSVFLELQCGYWDGASEDRMRAKLN